jgi:HD-GYP domain-containing protein (c-di-GMP phosphodiesterase class II)
MLHRAALLHDIGKLGISNMILDKPDRLSVEEYAVMRMHPVYAGEILSRIAVFAAETEVAKSHHERIDGRGYPVGLHGTAISLETRIVTVADIFDALTAERPYRAAMNIAEAIGLMTADVGAALDPGCFAALKSALEKTQVSIAA